MLRPNRIGPFALWLSCIALAGCTDASAPEEQAGAKASETVPSCAGQDEPSTVGLMTSLPIYWPLGADFASLARGDVDPPWQRAAIEQCATILLLDTLSEIAPLAPGGEEVDPLADLEHLAVIQPRGLSPADNVSLDRWVREGGRLLLVLDPMLTGEYELPLGDPARPVDSALIPPVVKRWGLDMRFKIHEVFADGIYDVPLAGSDLTVSHPGSLHIVNAGAGRCTILARDTVAQCAIGKGRVTLVADAALFEHREAAGAQGESLRRLLDYAFD